MTHHRTSPSLAVAAMAAASVGLGLTACSPSDAGATGHSTPPTSATSPSTPSTPTTNTPTPKTPQEISQTALEQYLAMSEKALRTGKIKYLARLTKVATGDAYFYVWNNQQTDTQNGIHLKGSVGHQLSSPTMTNAGTVNFTDCRDESRAKLVDKTGQELQTTDSNGNVLRVPDRYEVSYTVNLVPIGKAKKSWRVSQVNYKFESRC